MKIEKKYDRAILTPMDVEKILRDHITKETGRQILGKLHYSPQTGTRGFVEAGMNGFTVSCDLYDTPITNLHIG